MGFHLSVRSHAPARRILSLVFGLAAVAALGGCAGDQTVTVYDSTTITKGRELMDLQRALADGAISQSDYERLRRVILRRPN